MLTLYPTHFIYNLLLAMTFSLTIVSSAYAEPPMIVDDAGTLDKGAMKIEGAFNSDDKERGIALVFGFAPIKNIEVGLIPARASERSDSPSTQLHSVGIIVKWVPIQNDIGCSLGASFSHGQTKVHERAADNKYTEYGQMISGLTTCRYKNGQVVHLNLGAARLKAQAVSNTVGTWGAGYEYPLIKNVKLTVEIFGEQHSRPDKAIGLRYELIEGFKLYSAMGRGNDRSFSQVGFSWEF